MAETQFEKDKQNETSSVILLFFTAILFNYKVCLE